MVYEFHHCTKRIKFNTIYYIFLLRMYENSFCSSAMAAAVCAKVRKTMGRCFEIAHNALRRDAALGVRAGPRGKRARRFSSCSDGPRGRRKLQQKLQQKRASRPQPAAALARACGGCARPRARWYGGGATVGAPRPPASHAAVGGGSVAPQRAASHHAAATTALAR